MENLRYIALENSIELYWDKPEFSREGYEYTVSFEGQSFVTDKTHMLIEGLEPEKEYSFAVSYGPKGGTSIVAKTLKKYKRIDISKAPYNCVGDGKVLNTKMLQQAIDDCGIDECVYVPKGAYLTGALRLHSDMMLFVDEGATLQGTAELKDYLPKIRSRFEGIENECYQSLLNLGYLDHNGGYSCKNVIITGGGAIYGGGANLAKATIVFEREKMAEELKALGDNIKEYEHKDTIPGRMRGRLINMSNCRNVVITNLKLGQAASWNVHFIYSKEIITSRCTISSEGIWNGDGWDPDSSEDCTVFGCEFFTEDDSVAIKSGKNPEGNVIARPTKNIRIFDNEVHAGHGLCMGSEMSGGIEEVYIWDCRLLEAMSGIEIKGTKKRGGYVRNVFADNVETSHIMFHSVGYNDDGIGAEHPPVFEKCSFTNLKLSGHFVDNRDNLPYECDCIEVIGFDEPNYEIKDITFENITLGKPNIHIDKARGISLKNITVESFI